MIPPISCNSDGSYRWETELSPEHTLQLVAEEVRRERTGLYATIKIGVDRVPVSHGELKLVKVDERARLAKAAYTQFENGLESACSLNDLNHFLDLFCMDVPVLWEQSPDRVGAPAVRIGTDQCPIKPEYLLRPLVHKGHPSLIYADGGSGKSVFAEMVAITVSLAWRNNPLKMIPSSLPVKTLYLDWETDEEELRWRLCAMKDAKGLPEASFLYRSCRAPFHEDADKILRIVERENIGFIVVDSLGGACGSDLNKNDAANLYFSAMRTMGCASLTLTHITKEARDGSRGSSPFGTAYWWNWARSVWEIKKSQEVGEDELTIGLFHKKSNNTRLHKPIGYKLHFVNEADDLREISIQRVDVQDDPELSKGLSASSRIVHLLEGGCLGPEAISEALEIKKATVYMELGRLKRAGKVLKLGKEWGIAAGDLPF